MPRCDFCKKKAGLNLLICKQCDSSLCTRCIDMSIHECTEIEKFKDERRKSLENTLLSNKTVTNKRLSF